MQTEWQCSLGLHCLPRTSLSENLGTTKSSATQKLVLFTKSVKHLGFNNQTDKTAELFMMSLAISKPAIKHTACQYFLIIMHKIQQVASNNLSRLMTKPTKWLCAQRRLRSAWAPAWRKLGSLATYWTHSEDSLLFIFSWGGSVVKLHEAEQTQILVVCCNYPKYWDINQDRARSDSAFR